MITGILISKESFGSEYREVRVKGKLLLIGFLCYFLGAIFDAGATISTTVLILSRTILSLGAVMFYLGFLLPNKIKELFNLNEE